MADLPSGTVTFLFTDIEGSTRLVKQLRDQYADILQTTSGSSEPASRKRAVM
jgi:class 3 adenylate cyclase